MFWKKPSARRIPAAIEAPGRKESPMTGEQSLGCETDSHCLNDLGKSFWAGNPKGYQASCGLLTSHHCPTPSLPTVAPATAAGVLWALPPSFNFYFLPPLLAMGQHSRRGLRYLSGRLRVPMLHACWEAELFVQPSWLHCWWESGWERRVLCMLGDKGGLSALHCVHNKEGPHVAGQIRGWGGCNCPHSQQKAALGLRPTSCAAFSIVACFTYGPHLPGS